jgi:hypothetical protein
MAYTTNERTSEPIHERDEQTDEVVRHNQTQSTKPGHGPGMYPNFLTPSHSFQPFSLNSLHLEFRRRRGGGHHTGGQTDGDIYYGGWVGVRVALEGGKKIPFSFFFFFFLLYLLEVLVCCRCLAILATVQRGRAGRAGMRATV